MKPKVKKIVKFLGNIITLLAIFFIFKKLFSSDIDYSDLFKAKNILFISIVILVQAAIVITNCLPWTKLVEVLTNKHLSFTDTVPVYAKSNLLKYLPGNIFQYVGRNELALKKNIPHVEVATATIIDVMMTVLAAAIISVVFLSHFILSFLGQHSQTIKIVLLIAFIVLIALLIVIYLLRNKLKLKTRKYSYLLRPKTLKTLLFCLVYYIIVMMISSLMYMLVLIFVLNIPLDFSLFFKLFSAYTLSWLIGFITPGAPAGIGIKEAVMVAVSGGLINVDIITLSMVVFRVLSTLSDALGFVFSLPFTRKNKKIWRIDDEK